jgi:Rha family phage regulatory protein
MPENTMTNLTISTTVAQEVTSPTLAAREGQITATSLQVAEHFGKRHTHVLRSIRNLQVSEEFSRLNFGPRDYFDERGKVQPMYDITRDGFAMLAMGFTGKEAARWKEAYISTFNAMEAKLRALYVTPLLSQSEFRNGIKLQTKLQLMEQSRSTMTALVQETCQHAKENLYFQLRSINDTLGIPTASSKRLLGQDAPDLNLWEGRAR